MNIALLAMPLSRGLSNIWAPRAALAFKEGGGARLRREVTQDSLLLGLVMALFCIVVLFAGEHVMRLLYHGKEYEGNGNTVTVLVLATLAGGGGSPAFTGLGRAGAALW